MVVSFQTGCIKAFILARTAPPSNRRYPPSTTLVGISPAILSNSATVKLSNRRVSGLDIHCSRVNELIDADSAHRLIGNASELYQKTAKPKTGENQAKSANYCVFFEYRVHLCHNFIRLNILRRRIYLFNPQKPYQKSSSKHPFRESKESEPSISLNVAIIDAIAVYGRRCCGVQDTFQRLEDIST